MEMLVLADLYNTLEEYDNAIYTIRRGIRWLQGRDSQKFWDACGDDREFDVDGFARPSHGIAVSRLQPGRFALDFNPRHRLAIARLKRGDYEEGRVEEVFIAK